MLTILFLTVVISIPMSYRITNSGILKASKLSYGEDSILVGGSMAGLDSAESKVDQCLVHSDMNVTVPEKVLKLVQDPNANQLRHSESKICGKLRRDWTYNPPLSIYAKTIDNLQSNCSMPLKRHKLDNTNGLGSHTLMWGQALCNAYERNFRIKSFVNPNSEMEDWLWLDQEHCDVEEARSQSPLLCYFPNVEQRCGWNETSDQIMGDVRQQRSHCQLVKSSVDSRASWQAAATEYLFQRVSPIVIQEAQRQIGIIFGAEKVPDDLITVHIRWGDKFWEMDLPPIEEYFDAIRQLLPPGATTANIYLATEDPKALNETLAKKPDGWNIYYDITLNEIDLFRPRKGNRASWATKTTKGRAGLVALGSLLVAMEANKFVLTTKSNWSSMMNHLRMQIIDPRCNKCTKMIDLRPGLWEG